MQKEKFTFNANHTSSSAAKTVLRFEPGAPVAVLIATLIAWSLFATLPAAAVVIQGGGCVDDVSGLNNNCVANDLTFVAVGLGIQDDGCVSLNDTVSIFLRAQIANTTAQTRYDVGMYFATDGDPNNDGASTGVCAREVLNPASSVLGASDCPPLDLNGGTGPFFNADGDFCADLIAESNPGTCTTQGRTDAQGKTLRDAAIFDLGTAIEFPCRDVEVTPTGFVNIPLCSTWGNQNNQVTTDGNNTCDSSVEAVPGTKAKCRCEDLDSNIPAPDLGLSCTCASPTTVRPGFPVSCSVSYNNAATCSPDAGTEERFQCGTAGFVRYDLDDGRAGTESGDFAVNDAGRGATAGTPGVIEWTPRSTPENTLGIVGQGESDTLSFTYTVSPDASDGPVTLTTTTIWSNTADFSTTVPQSLTTTCDITVDATHATVTEVAAVRGDDGLEVTWETASEVGSLGFRVERWQDGGWVATHDDLLPAAQHLPGASYRLLDLAAPSRGVVHYRIVEEEIGGRQLVHGPYRLEPRERRHQAAETPEARRLSRETAFEARAHRPDAFDQERRRIARRLAGETEADKPGLAGPHSASRDAYGAGARDAYVAGARDTAPTPGARIEVIDGGLTRIDPDQLATAWGIPVAEAEKAIQQRRVRLTGGGEEVAWTAAPDGDGLLFVAEAIDSLFTRTNVYFATFERGVTMDAVRGPGQGNGRKTSGLSGPTTFVDTVRREEDLLGRPVVATDPNQDYWFWAGLLGGHPTLGSTTLSFPLDGVAGQSFPGALELGLWGISFDLGGPDHRALVRLNGHPLEELAWDGTGPRSFPLAVDTALLLEGDNELEIEVLTGTVFVDGFDLTYRRRLEATAGALELFAEDEAPRSVGGFGSDTVVGLDVTDRRQPRLLEVEVTADGAGGFQATVTPPAAGSEILLTELPATHPPTAVVTDQPSGLRDAANTADWIVVAPRALLPAARELAEHRAGQGLESLAVDLQDIYDEFHHGVASPEALRGFLAHAASSWARAPRHVVLAGKGSFDYRDVFGLGGNLMPPRLVASRHGLVPSDSSYATFGDDPLPRVAVGRLPVVSADELEEVVAKLRRADAATGAWRDRSLLVADNADSAGDFATDSDALAGTLPVDTLAGKVYLGQPFTLSEARGEIRNAFADGVGTVTYVGHGGFDRLAAEGLLTSADVPALGNAGRLPLVSALSCNIGIFTFPGFTSLGERLVVQPNGGALAVWAPMGLSLNREATVLGHELLPRLAGRSGDRLGDALLDGLAAYLAAGGEPQLMRIYGLLGDPASELP